MKNPVFVTRAFTISDSQDEWLILQAEKRLSNKSMIIREAIQLLQSFKADVNTTASGGSVETVIQEKDDG